MLALAIFFVLVVLCLASTEAWLWQENEYIRAFQLFISKFKRTYPTASFAKKLLNFKENLDKVTQSRLVKSKFRLGVTRFADLSPEEFAKTLGTFSPAPPAGSFVEEAATEELSAEALDAVFAESFDWSTKNVLRPARDQTSHCGACWAFAAASTIEAALSIRDKKLTEYVSTQAMVDCAAPCRGCEGGYATCAFDFSKNTGFYRDSDAPYKSKTLPCKASALTPIGKIKSYAHVPPSASGFATALRTNPLWVSLNAAPLQLYEDGIVDQANCSTKVNHAVVLVGLGVEDGEKYYKLRNSWRRNWGEQGHFRLASEGNICGIHSYGAYYPVLYPAAAGLVRAAASAASAAAKAAVKAVTKPKK